MDNVILNFSFDIIVIILFFNFFELVYNIINVGGNDMGVVWLVSVVFFYIVDVGVWII